MSVLTIKKVGKLLVILLITTNAFGQGERQFRDSILLKKELDSLLSKYGLKTKGFVINVISLDQKGGQTAYSITNNYYQNITVTQEPELTEGYKEYFTRRIEQIRKDSSITSVKILITIHNGSNAGKFAQQLSAYLDSLGYDTNLGSSIKPFTGFNVGVINYFDNKTKVIIVSLGNIDL